MNGPFSDVDIGSAEVHITEVVIKGLPKGDITYYRKGSLFIQNLYSRGQNINGRVVEGIYVKTGITWTDILQKKHFQASDIRIFHISFLKPKFFKK